MAEPAMSPDRLTRANMKTPRAAAIAGMVFSVLLITVFVLLRVSVPIDPQAASAAVELQDRVNKACNDASLVRNLAGSTQGEIHESAVINHCGSV